MFLNFNFKVKFVKRQTKIVTYKYIYIETILINEMFQVCDCKKKYLLTKFSSFLKDPD
jgi:hypothetical protein